MKVEALDESVMRTEDLHNQLVQRPKIDLGEISGKNSPTKELVRPANKFAKEVTET